MDAIINKISKLLALGERGGTEAEADSAMQKVHELLAKHNLSLDDVKGEAAIDEDYIEDAESAKAKQPWQRCIWNSLAKLYFCSYLTRTKRGTGEQFHVVIGKPSNIAVVKYMAAYVIRTGDELAREAAHGRESKVSFANSFKKGFAYRITSRVNGEIAKAKAGQMTDSTSGTALIVHPLYNQAKQGIDQYMLAHSLNPRTARSSAMPSNSDGMKAGMAAADTVSLSSNGVGHKAARQIGAA